MKKTLSVNIKYKFMIPGSLGMTICSMSLVLINEPTPFVIGIACSIFFGVAFLLTIARKFIFKKPMLIISRKGIKHYKFPMITKEQNISWNMIDSIEIFYMFRNRTLVINHEGKQLMIPNNSIENELEEIVDYIKESGCYSGKIKVEKKVKKHKSSFGDYVKLFLGVITFFVIMSLIIFLTDGIKNQTLKEAAIITGWALLFGSVMVFMNWRFPDGWFSDRVNKIRLPFKYFFVSTGALAILLALSVLISSRNENFKYIIVGFILVWIFFIDPSIRKKYLGKKTIKRIEEDEGYEE